MTATKQTEFVILVDQDDNPIGTAEKLAAHRENLCHRAFSVFILRKAPELQILLQQRALHKYHSPGLWTNTCCSHPRPGEDIIKAGERRLKEEMGIEAPLTEIGKFHYIAHFENGLVENEVDHVLVGFAEADTFSFNREEVNACRWISLPELEQEMRVQPEQFTPWLQEALDQIKINKFYN